MHKILLQKVLVHYKTSGVRKDIATTRLKRPKGRFCENYSCIFQTVTPMVMLHYNQLKRCSKRVLGFSRCMPFECMYRVAMDIEFPSKYWLSKGLADEVERSSGESWTVKQTEASMEVS